MSNESGAGNAAAVSPRFPGQGYSSQGQSGAKARPEGVADAQQADIPVPPRDRYDRRGDGEGYAGGVLDAPVKACRPQGRQIRPADKAETRDEALWRSCGAHAPWKNP